MFSHKPLGNSLRVRVFIKSNSCFLLAKINIDIKKRLFIRVGTEVRTGLNSLTEFISGRLRVFLDQGKNYCSTAGVKVHFCYSDNLHERNLYFFVASVFHG